MLIISLTIATISLSKSKHHVVHEKWNVSSISVYEGHHSVQQLQPLSMASLWALRELGKGRTPAIQRPSGNACHPAAFRLQPLPTVSPQETQDVETQDTGPRELRYRSKGWFRWARTLAPPHRTALNSLTWDIWFSLTYSHLLTLSDFVAKLLYNSSPRLVSAEQSSQGPLRCCLQGLHAKTSPRIKHNSQLSAFEYFSSLHTPSRYTA